MHGVLKHLSRHNETQSMFERLTDRFQDVFRKLTGRGVLTEASIEEAMRDVRRALLEADVNYEVAREFVANVRQKCLGREVLKSVAPGQQAVKIVYDELTAFLGEANAPLDLEGAPAVIMLIGLHGSGKTTTAAKLGRFLQARESRRVLLAACDLQRPAAITQLETLGRQLDIPVYANRSSTDVTAVAAEARRVARETGRDTLILDMAGRNEIDAALVRELVAVKHRLRPREVLLVADAALGQESVSVARHFDEALGLTGVILTKLDGDARGGAAVSIRHVTGRPVKFVGTGERPVDLEPFFPDRMASRILGMGDVVSLVEKAGEEFEEEEARRLEEKMRKQTFGFDDFRDQLRRLKKMGGLLSLLDFLPGAGKLKQNVDIDEGQLARIEGIICSMTPEERSNPDLLNLSRRRRIARGSGVELAEVSQLINQFQTMRQVMGRMMGGGLEGLATPGLGGGFPGMAARRGPARTKAVARPRKQRNVRKKKKKKRRR